MFNLPAIKELCEAAQDGPWESQPHQELAAAGNFFTRWDIITQQKRLVVKGIYGSDDAEFIAQARTLVPQLVEALEEAQAENARLQTELKMARACDSDALMVSELACLQARVEEAEQQLRDQVAGDLGDYLEVVGRGVQVLNYVDMMLLPRMEGLAESLQASYEHTAKLEALAERRKKALVRLERGYDNHPGFMTMGKSGEECLHCGCLGGHGDVCPFAAIEEEEK
ncbi:hypothetical protein LCGC14_2111060 [marine sediment metagenome]|uniref:Uncharacterized protein n=1 Tax=marine sediment metagenome TaxID=412755 RepID=A0A0F9E760_9ZZZZ